MWQSNVAPLLVLNKIDQIVEEFGTSSEPVYQRFASLIVELNILLTVYSAS